MINFPNNPSVGDAFTQGGVIYLCVITRDGEIQPAGVDDRPILALTVLEVQALVNEVTDLRTRITALEAT